MSICVIPSCSPDGESLGKSELCGEGASGKNPLSRLRRQLSRRESPWQNQQVSSSFVNGRRSQPLSCKLSALAKASPFRERWHGEAVTERVAFRTNPLSRLRRQLSRRASPWQNQQVSSSFVNGRKKSAVKLQTLRPCQSLSLSGEVARRSRDGEGCFREEPSQSRCARQLSRRESPWQRGQVSSSPVNGRKKSAVKL